MRRDGVKEASEVCQVVGVGVQSASRCVRMRQEGVRVALGRLQDYFWPQDGVRMASRMVHVCVRKCQSSVRMASGWCQDDVRIV